MEQLFLTILNRAVTAGWLVLLVMVLVFGFISLDPPLIMMLGFVGYTISGVLFTLMQLRRSRAERRRDAARDRDVA